MPARKGNQLKVTHGVRLFLANGSLPAGCSHIQNTVREFRAAIVEEVELAHGTVSFYHESVIQEACTYETVALLWQRWLRLEIKTLTVDQRLAVTQAIARARRDRNAALKELGLNRNVRKDAIDALFANAAPKPTDDSTAGDV